MPSVIEGRTAHSEWRAEPLPAAAAAALGAIVGPANLLQSIADRFAYARDRLPWGLFQLRAGRLPATLPAAILSPGSPDELIKIVEAAIRFDVRLIPFGAGSGVLGGTLPLNCEVMVDLKRLNRILEIDEVDCTVRVQAGMNGGQFEAALCTPSRICKAASTPCVRSCSVRAGRASCASTMGRNRKFVRRASKYSKSGRYWQF